MMLSSVLHHRHSVLHILLWQKMAFLAFCLKQSYSSEDIGPLFSKATFLLPLEVPGTQSAPHLKGLT